MSKSINPPPPKNTHTSKQSETILAIPTNQISVTSEKTKRGSGRFYEDELLFKLHGCKIKSFWYEILSDINGVITTSHLYTLRESINYIATNNPVSLKILKTPPRKLSPQKIKDLFISIEDYIDTKDIERKDLAIYSITSIFKKCNVTLNNGDKLSQLKYKGRFKHKRGKARKIISELFDPYFSDDPELASPISTLRFSSEKILQQKMLRHLEARNNRLEKIYTSIINEYIEWRETIIYLKKQPSVFTNNELLDICKYQIKAKRLFEEKKPEEQLQAYLKIINNLKLYEPTAHKHFIDNGYNLNSLFQSELNEKYPSIKNYLTSPNSSGALYCDKYLPALVIYAVQRLFQIWFCYNSDTVKQMLIEDIHFEHGKRYLKITPIKHKTDDEQEREIDIRKEPYKEKIIKLIIWHYNNINKYCKRHHESIWSGLTQITKPANLIDSSTLHKKILKKYNHPYFSVEQIRDQMLCTELVRTGNPFDAMKLAGHKTLQTLINYADQSVIRIASEANINEFQQQLNDTIIWATKRKNKRNINEEEINKRLLFPVSDNGYETTLPEVDEWIGAIKSNKNRKLILTEERIEWCLRQHLYYSERWGSINQANPERFKVIHLPRIIFTSALHKVIKKKQPDIYRTKMNIIISSKGM